MVLSNSAKYILTIAISTACAYLSQQRTKKLREYGRQDYFFFFVAVFAVILFVGLRTAYNDTVTYMASYKHGEPQFDQFMSDLWAGEYSIGGNPGFHLICSIMKSMGLNSHWFIMLFGIFTTGVYFWFMHKYSGDDFALSVYLFMLLGSTYLISALKQVTATAVGLIAVDRFLRGKNIRFFILIFIAITIHPYVFLLLSIPLLSRKKPWTPITFIMLVAFLVFGLSTRWTVGLMEDVTGYLGDESYTAEYILTGTGVNVFRFLVYLSPVLLSFLYKEILFGDSDISEDLFTQLQILGMSFMFLALFIATILVGRLPGYFMVMSCISIAWMLNKLCRYNLNIYKYLAVILFLIYFIYDQFINKNFNARYDSISLWELLTSGA